MKLLRTAVIGGLLGITASYDLRADTLTYQVTVDTTAINGLGGFLDFDFAPGNGSQAAFVTISDFSPGPPATAFRQVSGGVTGDLPGTLTIDNSTQFNDYFVGFNYDAAITFLLTLDGPALTSPDAIATSGSTFAFGIFDGSGSNPLLTADPNGNTFTVDVNLDGTTTVTTFPSDGNGGAPSASLTPVTTVPEPSAVVLLALELASLVAWRWRPLRRAWILVPVTLLPVALPAQPVNVSSQVRVITSGFPYSRVTRTFNGTIAVTNIGTQPIGGPVEIVLTQLPPGVTLTNSGGVFGGSPFATLAFSGTLAPGQQSAAPVQFADLFNTPITFTPVTWAGSFNPVQQSISFVGQPGNTTIGAVINPAVWVLLQDNYQRPVPSVAVTLSLGPNPPSPAALGGTLTETTDANGIARFSDLTLNSPGNGYTLLATAPGTPTAASRAFNEVPRTGTVSFAVQPGNTPVGAVISPPIQVVAQDNQQHPLPGLAVTLILGPNPPNPALLAGTLTETTDANGIARFPDLTLDYFGNGYTLLATATGGLTVTSQTFNESRVGEPCLGPNPACSSGCADSDRDGLNDAWELAGGVDMNGDGKIDEKYDVMLPGADPNKPDVYTWYDYLDYGLPGNACTQDSQCPLLGGGHVGETCIAPSPTGLTCAMACTVDSECTSRIPSGAHTGERCIANLCQHTHDPLAVDASGLQPVVDRYAAHGINLHIMRGHALPHSHVISPRRPDEFDDSCEGASLASGTAGIGKYAASYFDIQSGSNPDRYHVAYHYAFFSHYFFCDTAEHCTPPSLGGSSTCPFPTNPDGTPQLFGTSGNAEIGGRFLVLSLGGLVNDEAFIPHFRQQAVFMHELGHNLGLDHGGMEPVNYKPNYLSIMNYRYEDTGIFIANAVGSSTPISCTVDSQCGGDGGMCLGVCVRLDYSRQTLPTGGNTPGALAENNLNEPAGLGSGTTDIFTYKNGACPVSWKLAPTTGPVDWSGSGTFTATNATADVDAIVGVGNCAAKPTDILKGFTDWPDLSGVSFEYNFQCRFPGGIWAGGVGAGKGRVP